MKKVHRYHWQDKQIRKHSMMYWDLGKVFSYGEKALGKTGKPGAGKKYDCSERQNR